MPIYVAQGRRAIRTVETATVTVEAETEALARRKAKGALASDETLWTHDRGPETSDPNIERIEILVEGTEEIPENS